MVRTVISMITVRLTVNNRLDVAPNIFNLKLYLSPCLSNLFPFFFFFLYTYILYF